MLVGQLKEMVNSLPAEFDKLPALVGMSVNGERIFDLVVHFGILPTEPAAAVLVCKSEYDRMVAAGEREPYPGYEPPKPEDDITPGDEWKYQ